MFNVCTTQIVLVRGARSNVQCSYHTDCLDEDVVSVLVVAQGVLKPHRSDFYMLSRCQRKHYLVFMSGPYRISGSFHWVTLSFFCGVLVSDDTYKELERKNRRSSIPP